MNTETKDEPASNVLPFGKYAGETIEMVRQKDPDYLNWLKGQNWMRREKFIAHLEEIMRGMHSDDCTPEHNKMQLRFLQPAEGWKLVKATLARLRTPGGLPVPGDWKMNGYNVDFETLDGWDLTFDVRMKTPQGPKTIQLLVELKPTMGDDYPAVLRQIMRRHGQEHGGWPTLVIGELTSAAASLQELRDVFARKKITLITLGDVDAVKL